MNNLYHKVAVAFACTALSCALGANKEAKAATFTLYANPFFMENLTTGPGYRVLSSEFDDYNPYNNYFSVERRDSDDERRAFYEFDIGNLSLTPNTFIKSAILNTPIARFEASYRYFFLDLFG
jgi:hypothetical protein